MKQCPIARICPAGRRPSVSGEIRSLAVCREPRPVNAAHMAGSPGGMPNLAQSLKGQLPPGLQRCVSATLLLPFLTCALVGSAQAVRPEPCLPHLNTGRWNTSGSRPIWQNVEASRECEIEDGLQVTIARNLSVLFLGDSLERTLLEDICSLAYDRGLSPHVQLQQLPEALHDEATAHLAYDALLSCRLPGGYLQQTGFVLGTWPTGPYWLAYAHSNTPPQERVAQAKRLFLQQWGAQPDVIVLNANYWDNFRFTSDEYGITNLDGLESWKAHFFELLELVNDLFPRTKIKFYHTSIVRVANEQLREPVIADLNKAGATMAYQAGWQVVDLTRLVENFESFTYLRDAHHPQPFITTALYDLYLSSAAKLLPRRLRGHSSIAVDN